MGMTWKAGRAVLAVATMLLAAACVTTRDLEYESEDAFEKLRNEAKISANGRERAYVNCVSRAIILELPAPYAELDWDIEVFVEPDANAFAMMGGKIGVNTGLFDVAGNQDQLAAVIGHEIAHVTEKHQLTRANSTIAIGAGAQVLGAVTGTGSMGSGTAGMLGQLGLLLPFTRGQESEADVIGLRYMAAAGFDPRQSVKLWQNMQKANKGGPPQFLSTHPSPDNRIDSLVGMFPETLKLYNDARAAGKTPQCTPP
jgi:predicted Zn-dependent protease